MVDEIGSGVREALEAAKRGSVAQKLFKAARLVDALALARIREATGVDIRPAHTRLFPHIDLEGTRQTVIAQRVGISKQAVGPLVDELVQAGMLERVPDPADGRAKLVRFASRDGELGLFHGLRMLGMLETELAQQVGSDAWDALDRGLDALLTHLERR